MRYIENKDDRTVEEKQTHRNIIGGYDRFMSGWGGNLPSHSYAYWAATDEDVELCKRWIEWRGDIEHIRIYRDKPPQRTSECHHHIYTFEPKFAKEDLKGMEV